MKNKFINFNSNISLNKPPKKNNNNNQMKQAQYSFTQIRRLEQIKFHLLFLGFEIQEWRFEGNHPYIHRYNDCTGENQRNR